MSKITKRLVDSLKPGERDVFAWDDELRGFGIRVKPSGAKSYLVQYRNKHGRSRRLTLGAHGRLTAEQARDLAGARLGEVDAGADPAEDRKSWREAPTVADFADRYLEHHAEVKKKERSVAEDRRLVEKHIRPALGSRKLADVSRADVTSLHHAMRGTPYQANRVLALISKMMNLAERWGDRPDESNPCRHVEKYPEDKRERFLSADELTALGDVLADAEHTQSVRLPVIAAIRLLIFTGCRLSEILELRWQDVEFGGQCLRLPDSKTGRKTVHLNAPALAVLEAIEREDGNPWVIRGQKANSPLVNLEKPWRDIRKVATVRLWSTGGGKPAALVSELRGERNREPTYADCIKAAKEAEIELPVGVADVRLHDLRHSFASVAVGLGEGLPMIGKLLGHTQAQTTHRYAHLAADPVKAATERVGAALAGMMGGKNADVVPLRHNKNRA